MHFDLGGIQTQLGKFQFYQVSIFFSACDWPYRKSHSYTLSTELALSSKKLVI